MINSLQSIRYLLALMIFVHHYVYPPYNPFGDFPVAFFFILSGYVMTLGYHKRILSSSFNYKLFLYKRIKKIYPLHLIMMIIALMPTVVSAMIHSNYSTLKELLYSIPAFLLIHAWIPDIKYTHAGNSVSWFLSSMLFCYVMAPFIIRMALSYFKKMILLFVLILAIYFIIILYIPTNRIGYYVYIFPLSRLLDFSMGVLLFQLMYIFPYNCNQTNNISTTRMTILEALSFLLVWIAMIFGAMVPPQYELASLYWIPSISIILVFATFGPRGGVYFRSAQ